jgi:hypothetical protein
MLRTDAAVNPESLEVLVVRMFTFLCLSRKHGVEPYSCSLYYCKMKNASPAEFERMSLL